MPEPYDATSDIFKALTSMKEILANLMAAGTHSLKISESHDRQIKVLQEEVKELREQMAVK